MLVVARSVTVGWSGKEICSRLHFINLTFLHDEDGDNFVFICLVLIDVD